LKIFEHFTTKKNISTYVHTAIEKLVKVGNETLHEDRDWHMVVVGHNEEQFLLCLLSVCLFAGTILFVSITLHSLEHGVMRFGLLRDEFVQDMPVRGWAERDKLKVLL
jgi:hypothetical protein